jgi:hypothetical protein
MHAEVFQKAPDTTVNVFLCGSGASDPSSMRAQIDREISQIGKVQVIFPEWLFATLLGQPGFDLLTLESELAASVDLIVLPLEGPGTFAELGAFASFESLRGKMLILNRAAFRHARSFITLGPVKLIHAHTKDSIVYYEPGEEMTVVRELRERLKRLKKREAKDNMRTYSPGRFVFYRRPLPADLARK